MFIQHLNVDLILRQKSSLRVVETYAHTIHIIRIPVCHFLCALESRILPTCNWTSILSVFSELFQEMFAPRMSNKCVYIICVCTECRASCGAGIPIAVRVVLEPASLAAAFARRRLACTQICQSGHGRECPLSAAPTDRTRTRNRLSLRALRLLSRFHTTRILLPTLLFLIRIFTPFVWHLTSAAILFTLLPTTSPPMKNMCIY